MEIRKEVIRDPPSLHRYQSHLKPFFIFSRKRSDILILDSDIPSGYVI